jgi:protein-disulfide isomerase
MVLHGRIDPATLINIYVWELVVTQPVEVLTSGFAPLNRLMRGLALAAVTAFVMGAAPVPAALAQSDAPAASAADQGQNTITETPNVSTPGSMTTVENGTSRTDERVLGNPDAPVTMFEYASMTCPHCAAFHTDTLPRLKAEYIDTGKVKLVFRDFPFDGIALRASMLARCVPPARYFDFIGVLFKNQERWARSRDPLQALATFGALVGLDANAVNECLADENLQNAILTRQLEGQERLSIRSTPTFILNNDEDRIMGAEDYSVFKSKIDRLLPENRS